ncbi:MAG: TlpA family protein disulfide reductase [Deltaproteobacteria bacterium]|nr:TlpA family protein disulfide reductase [Candidatus Anaeroferrophillus wilburensis]MBN2889703.1 TlpA family protein disulfide reductase [Deltaproteobacteria bacterium]
MGHRIAVMLTILGVCFLPACTTPPPVGTTPCPEVRLPAPPEEGARHYLGLPAGMEEFTFADISAKVLVVEMLQVQCPHCQGEAPSVNEFYQLVKKRGLADRIKVMGIATGNTPFEVDLYRRRYQVPFPLIADPGGRQLSVAATPTFFVIEPHADGGQVLYEKKGGLPGGEKFLNLIIERARLE